MNSVAYGPSCAGPAQWVNPASVVLRRLGDGPTARTLATLGIDSVKPMIAFRTDDLRAILPLGKDLGLAVPNVCLETEVNRHTERFEAWTTVECRSSVN